jgi:UDP-N-acetylmuramate: L-alanyl-gamma-D-glutamyl-meso-diaminopimelate ligase
LIAYDGSANVDDCVSKAFCKVERYGISERATWRVVDLRFTSERTTWRVLREGKPWAELDFALAGEFNVLNASAAAALAHGCGVEVGPIQEALHTFKSVKRRLEVKAEVGGITIIDDFAHHPTAVAETLKALRERYAGRRLWAIFEPRSNTLRRKVFEAELARSLAFADQVVVASVFNAEAIPPAERMDTGRVIQAIGAKARELPDADSIIAAIVPELHAGDVVAILSNGGFGGIYEKLPRQIQSKREVASRA